MPRGRPRKIQNFFKPVSIKSQPSAQGTTGYDNPRENIDPHIKTKVISTKEGSITSAPKKDSDIVNLARHQKEIKFTSRIPEPLVTFVFDDGHITASTLALPMFEAQGEVAVSAITTSFVNQSANYMDWSEIKALESAGWEIISHGVTHTNLTTLSESEIIEELVDSKDALLAQGLNITNFGYPHGANNVQIKQLTRRYYRSSRGTGEYANPRTNWALDTFDLNAFDGDDHTKLATYKGYVDDAESDKSWIMFYIHAIDSNDVTALNELIDYIQAKSIKIVTIEQALDLVGNYLDAGDGFAISERGFITPRGDVTEELRVDNIDIYNNVITSSTGTVSFDNDVIQTTTDVKANRFLTASGTITSVLGTLGLSDTTAIALIKDTYVTGNLDVTGDITGTKLVIDGTSGVGIDGGNVYRNDTGSFLVLRGQPTGTPAINIGVSGHIVLNSTDGVDLNSGTGNTTASNDLDVTGEMQSDTAHIGGATHYSQFESDGTLEFNGNATVWDDLRVPVSSVGRLGFSDPDWVQMLTDGDCPESTGVYALAFDGGVTTEEVFFTVQLPHSWKQNTDITPHVHWCPTDSDCGNVVWQLEYSWANINEVFAASTIISVTDETAGAANTHQMANFAAISPCSGTISSMIVCRLFRDPSHASDDYESDAILLEIDFHYQLDTVGSRAITSK